MSFREALETQIAKLDKIVKPQGYKGPFQPSDENKIVEFAAGFVIGHSKPNTVTGVSWGRERNGSMENAICLVAIETSALDPNSWEFRVCEVPLSLAVIQAQGGIKNIKSNEFERRITSQLVGTDGAPAMVRPITDFFAELPASNSPGEPVPTDVAKRSWLTWPSVVSAATL